MDSLDQKRQSEWFAGRLYDADMGEWVRMPEPTVLHLNKHPWMRAGITSGGKGKRFVRRVSRVTRNAIAVIQALSEVGCSLELAVNICVAMESILGDITKKIDTMHRDVGTVRLADVDPDGKWLDTDEAPAQIWNKEESSLWPKYFVPDGAIETHDEHFIIVNARFVFHQKPKRKPKAFLIITDDRKSVRVPNDLELKKAKYALSNFKTFSQVNISMAVRQMKRRAFGLTVNEL